MIRSQFPLAPLALPLWITTIRISKQQRGWGAGPPSLCSSSASHWVIWKLPVCSLSLRECHDLCWGMLQRVKISCMCTHAHTYTGPCTSQTFFFNFIYSFLAALGLCRCLWTVSSGGRLRICGTGAQLLQWHVCFSQTKDGTCVPCIGRWTLNYQTTREVPRQTPKCCSSWLSALPVPQEQWREAGVNEEPHFWVLKYLDKWKDSTCPGWENEIIWNIWSV